MNNEKPEYYEIKLDSTPLLCVPAMVATAKHLYKYGEGQKEAIMIMRDLFQDKIKDDAIIKILTEEYQPIWDKRLVILSETYLFHVSELAQSEVDKL